MNKTEEREFLSLLGRVVKIGYKTSKQGTCKKGCRWNKGHHYNQLSKSLNKRSKRT